MDDEIVEGVVGVFIVPHRRVVVVIIVVLSASLGGLPLRRELLQASMAVLVDR